MKDNLICLMVNYDVIGGEWLWVPTLVFRWPICVLEKRYLDNCPPKFKIVVYQRYVDDVFCLFGKEEDVDLVTKVS